MPMGKESKANRAVTKDPRVSRKGGRGGGLECREDAVKKSETKKSRTK